MTKPTRWQFKPAATAAIRELGATDTPVGFYPLQIDTKAGRLLLDVWDDSVVTRFDDVAKARTVLGSDPRLNPYSGKWNFHGISAAGDTPDDLSHFLSVLRSVL